MSLKMFKFGFRNMTTGESMAFIGQGETVADAFKEGTKNVTDPFRPSSSGERRPDHGLAVTLPDGRVVSRTLKAFEGDEPYNEPKETKAVLTFDQICEARKK